MTSTPRSSSSAATDGGGHLLPIIAQKFAFPWGLIPGVFEKFATICLLNSASDMYYKIHKKNFAVAYSEDDSIA